MFKPNNAKQNQQAVISSQILAKAVTQLSNGRYELIVVFALSTRIEHYWLFQARSPRSPIRSWKLLGCSTRDLPHHYFDFSSFVSHHASLRGARIVSVRMPHKRQLATLKNKTAHESIYSDWSPVQRVPSIDDARKLLKRIRKGGYGIRVRRSLWSTN